LWLTFLLRKIIITTKLKTFRISFLKDDADKKPADKKVIDKKDINVVPTTSTNLFVTKAEVHSPLDDVNAAWKGSKDDAKQEETEC